jgi:hypothetical protein
MQLSHSQTSPFTVGLPRKRKKHLKIFDSYFLQHLHETPLSEKYWIVQYKIIDLLMVIFSQSYIIVYEYSNLMLEKHKKF